MTSQTFEVFSNFNVSNRKVLCIVKSTEMACKSCFYFFIGKLQNIVDRYTTSKQFVRVNVTIDISYAVIVPW